MGNMGLYRAVGFNPAEPAHVLAASVLACAALLCVGAFVGAVGRAFATLRGWGGLRLGLLLPLLLFGIAILMDVLSPEEHPHLIAEVILAIAAMLGASAGLWMGWAMGPDKTPAVPDPPTSFVNEDSGSGLG
jgi:hypothetical protein